MYFTAVYYNISYYTLLYNRYPNLLEEIYYWLRLLFCTDIALMQMKRKKNIYVHWPRVLSCMSFYCQVMTDIADVEASETHVPNVI